MRETYRTCPVSSLACFFVISDAVSSEELAEESEHFIQEFQNDLRNIRSQDSEAKQRRRLLVQLNTNAHSHRTHYL